MQWPHAGHEMAGTEDFSSLGPDTPTFCSDIVNGAFYPCAQSQVAAKAEPLDTICGISLDLIAACIHPRPVGIGGERKAVQMRGYVALCARVTVMPPGSADSFGLLKNQKIRTSCPHQRGAHGDSGHSGAQNHDIMIQAAGETHGFEPASGRPVAVARTVSSAT